MKILEIVLDQGTEASFLAALDEANIDYGSPMRFSDRTDFAQTIIHVGRIIMDGMPWNAFARVVEAWITAKYGRKAYLELADGTVVELSGYSEDGLLKLLEKGARMLQLMEKNNVEARSK